MERFGKILRRNSDFHFSASALMVFAYLYVFFSRIHRLVMFDSDDWLNISLPRNPIPLWHAWNPVKVLPETLFSMAGYFAAWFVAPVTGDYFFAVTAVSAAITSVCIAAMFYVLCKTIEKVFCISSAACIGAALFFLESCFVIFCANDANNRFMFWAQNLTCYYHYVIPAILNASLVLYLMKVGEMDVLYGQWAAWQKSLFVFAVYFAIFSNICDSVILAMYVAWDIALETYRANGSIAGKIRGSFRNRRIFWIILMAWIVSLLFEANGGRSHAIGMDTSLRLRISESFSEFGSFAYSGTWAVLAALAVYTAIYLSIRNKALEKREVLMVATLRTAVCLAGVFAFLIIVCSKAGTGYAGRADVMFGVFFYGVLFVAICIAFIVKNVPSANVFIVPLVLLVLGADTVYAGRSYAESNAGNHSPGYCLKVDRMIADQVKDAVQQGKSQMILRVPKGDNRDNWPHAIYMGDRPIRTLYCHGVIDNDSLKATAVEVDPSMDDPVK